jgi:hypothetical protein
LSARDCNDETGGEENAKHRTALAALGQPVNLGLEPVRRLCVCFAVEYGARRHRQAAASAAGYVGEYGERHLGAYAVAILSGTIGAVFLLMKNKGAANAFLISVAALILQFSNPIGFALGADQAQMIIFPLFIIAMAVLEFFLARKWRDKGWLS